MKTSAVRSVANQRRYRWWWGGLLLGGTALTWGILARSAARPPSTPVGGELSQSPSVPQRVAKRDLTTSDSPHDSLGEVLPCPQVRLHDVESDEAGRIRGAWLSMPESDAVWVGIGEGFGPGVLERASRGSAGQLDARLRTPTGLCRASLATGTPLEQLVSEQNETEDRASAGQVVQRLSTIVRRAGALTALRKHRGDSGNASAGSESLESEALEDRASGTPAENASSSGGERASTLGRGEAMNLGRVASRLRQRGAIVGRADAGENLSNAGSAPTE